MMMVEFNKIREIPNICGVQLAFSGEMVPSAIEGYQRFNNSIPKQAEFQNAHFSRASVDFTETSEETAAGKLFKQKLVIRFPASDKSRAERIELVHKVKFIKVQLANGKDLVMGRNDFEQNARPKVKTKVDERIAQVEFETSSMFSAGYTPRFDAAGLPAFFPIDFIND